MPTAPASADFTLRVADWERDGAAVRAVREAVFVREQGIAARREWDEMDAQALHALAIASADAQPIGTGRCLPDGRIGRLAVLPAWRGHGIGQALLATLVRHATANDGAAPWLHAPTHMLDYYRRLGFAAEGDPFEEANIPHRRMRLTDSDAIAPIDLRCRYVGRTPGRLRLTKPTHLATAVATMARQARQALQVFTPDLEPPLYDQDDFLAAARRLAVERRGHLPVRVLLINAEPAIRRGHRLIELARQLSSDLRIQAVPDEQAEHYDRFMLVDDRGYCLTRPHDPQTALVDYHNSADTRRLRRRFDRIWEQSQPHQALRRLHL